MTSKTRARAQAPAPSVAAETSPETPFDLSLAAQSIFEDGSNSFVLADGFVVTVKTAKMGQIPGILKFFNAAVERIGDGPIADIVDVISAKQKALIAEGKDPKDIDIRELASTDVVSSAFQNSAIISTVLSQVADELPALCALFTNVTPERYGEMEFDEGFLILTAVFLLNYSFFTQRLLPILMGFIRSLASRGKNIGNVPLAAKLQRR